jgi:putative MATE family efflux protein
MRQVLGLAWPAVVEQILIVGVDLTDLFIVGHLGAVALSAVGLTGQVVLLAIAFFSAIGVGCLALIARQIGAGAHAEAGRILQQSILVAAALGTLAGLGMAVFAPDILRGLGAEPDVVSLGVPFMRLVALSLPLLAIAFVANSAMRAAGDTRTPMQLTSLQLIVNAALGLFLVYGPPHLSVVGVGVATSVARGALGLAAMGLLWRGRSGLRLASHDWKPDRDRLWRVLRVGLPAGVEQMLMQFALVSVTVVITNLGTVQYAAHNVSLRIMSLSYLPGWGFAVAASTLVGQGLGANDPRRAEAGAYAALRLAISVMLVVGAALYVLAEPIARIFTNDAGVIAASISAIHVAALSQPIMATSFVFVHSLRGAGDTRTVLAITSASIWTVRLGVAYVGAHVLGWGLAGAWLGLPADFAVRALCGWARFRGGKWQKVKV